MRLIVVGGVILAALGAAGCTSAEGAGSPSPTPVQEIVSSCNLQTNDVFLPPGGEEIFEAALAAPMPEGVFVATRAVFEPGQVDRTMTEAFVRVCSQEPLTRAELIEAGTAVAVEIAARDVGEPLERLTLRGWHLREPAVLVDAEAPVSTAFALHDWATGGEPDPDRWQ